jgi:hypothetical protein
MPNPKLRTCGQAAPGVCYVVQVDPHSSVVDPHSSAVDPHSGVSDPHSSVARLKGCTLGVHLSYGAT